VIRIFIINLVCLAIVIIQAQETYSLYWKNKKYSSDLTSIIGNAGSGDETLGKLIGLESGFSHFEMGRFNLSKGDYSSALVEFHNSKNDDLCKLFLAITFSSMMENDSVSYWIGKVRETDLSHYKTFMGRKRSNEDLKYLLSKYPYFSNFILTTASKKSEPSTKTKLPKKSYKPIDRRYYTIQFGAFLDSLRAVALANKLEISDITPYIKKYYKDGNILFKVRWGHFNSREEAKKNSIRISDDFVFIIIEEE
jgi:hypothetical protein